MEGGDAEESMRGMIGERWAQSAMPACHDGERFADTRASVPHARQTPAEARNVRQGCPTTHVGMLPDVHSQKGDELGGRLQGVLVGGGGDLQALGLRVVRQPSPAGALVYRFGVWKDGIVCDVA